VDDVAVEEVEVREGSTSMLGVGEERVVKDQCVVGPIEEKSNNIIVGLNQDGPLNLGSAVSGQKELVGLEVGSGPEITQVEPVKGNCVIDKLDNLVSETRVKFLERHNQEFTFEDSNLSSSSSSSDRGRDQTTSKVSNRQKKPLTRFPFPHLVGPKCLRLVEVVNSVSGSSRRKKGGKEVSMKRAELTELDGVEVQLTTTVVEDSLPQVSTEVGVGIQAVVGNQSGVNLILEGDSGDEVEELITNRKDPVSKRQEAEKILEIQSDLGITFHEDKNTTVDRLLVLEDRDREKLEGSLENHGFQ
jgi:hypothetical protein